jgi:hypothetical protein
MRQRTVRANAAWIRRWAWAISLVLTIVGFGIVLPFTTHPFGPSLLVRVPLAWFIIYAATRLAAALLPKALFPGEE